jgi:hypothetical protein
MTVNPPGFRNLGRTPALEKHHPLAGGGNTLTILQAILQVY